MVLAFPGHIKSRQPVKLRLNARNKRLERSFLAIGPGLQQPRKFLSLRRGHSCPQVVIVPANPGISASKKCVAGFHRTCRLPPCASSAGGGVVAQPFGLKGFLGLCVMASYGFQAKPVERPQSGLDRTVCNQTEPNPCSVPNGSSADGGSGARERTRKLEEIVAMLRVLWGADFDSNYRKYMLGSMPVVALIPRMEMIRVANARLDGMPRDGQVTQGLTLNRERIVVVYDDIAPLFVAKVINHEIGHLQLRNAGLSPNDEEARIRKVIDTNFFAEIFGQQWLESTIAAVEEKVLPVERDGRVYKGHTPQAVATLYERLGRGGVKVEQNSVHTRILETVVFILANSEEGLSAALDADDTRE
jgi:hypothetical protein